MGCWNLVLGKFGEKIAISFLSKKGYKIIKKNFRSYFGEVDLIARKNGRLIFIEVKTRTTDSFGPPYLSVKKDKLMHITRSALLYIKTKGIHEVNWRIDIVSIELFHNKKIKNIQIFENVFEENH